MSEIDHYFNSGTLLPLLERANRIAASLAVAKYDDIEQWVAEVKLTLVHGVDALDRVCIQSNQPISPRFKVVARILPKGHYRYFTLEEAELILEKLAEDQP